MEALFATELLLKQLQSRRQQLADEVNGRPESYWLTVDTGEVVEYLAAKYGIEVPVLDEDAREVVFAGEAPDDVFTVHPQYLNRVIFAVPFTGDSIVFSCRPSHYSTDPPHGSVVEHPGGVAELRLAHASQTVQSAQELSETFKAQLERVQTHLAWAANDIRLHNADVRALATNMINTKREHAEQRRSAIAEAGFVIRERPDAARFRIPEEPRRLTIPQPKPKVAEPHLEQQQYEQVIGALRNVILGLERSPEVALNYGEEHIRDLLLLGLNAQFVGSPATGETFNGEGKTDILVRVDGRNVFIAEVKIWRGPSSVRAALDQLLRSYLVWRDTKAAVVLIIRQPAATDVIAKARTAIESDPQHVQSKPANDDTHRQDFTMRARDDEQRPIHLALLPTVLPGSTRKKA